MLTRARRRLRHAAEDGPLSRLLLALVTVSVLVSVGLPAIGIGVLHPTDVLQLYAPWASDAAPQVQVHNTATSDTIDATVPVRVEQRRRLLSGDIPLWSDLQAGGAPLASIPNSSAFSPLTLPWYVVPIWYAPAASKLLEMAVAGLFMFLFARRIRLSRAAALVGALAYVNSGFQVVWTNWPQSHVGALIPALFWAVDRAARRGRPVDVVPLALVSASMWLEGFPAVTLWAHTAAGLYALVSFVVRRRGRAAGVTLGGVVLGLGIAAVQLVPFGFRLGELDVAYRYAPEKIRDLPWRGLLTMVVPDAFGNPVDKVFYGDKNYVELVAFVGAVALILALVGLATGRASRVSPWVRRTFWVGAAVALSLVFFGGPPLDAFQRIPVIGPNAIGRMRSLLGFAIAVLAAIGVDGLLRAELGRRTRLLVVALLAAFAAVFGWLVRAVVPAAVQADQLDYLRSELVLPGVVAVLALVTVGALLWTGGRSRPRQVGVALLAVLMAVETVAFAAAWMPEVDRDLFYPRTDAHRFLADGLGGERFAASGSSRDNTFVPGTTTYYDLRSVTAHSLTPEPYADLLRTLDPRVFRNNRTYPMLTPGAEIADSPILDRMAVRYYAESPATPLIGSREVVTGQTDEQRLPAQRSFHVEVPAGPLRGVQLQLHEPVGPEVDTRVKVEVFDAGGTLVAEGKRRVYARESAGRFDVAVMPRDGWPDDGGPWTVRIALDASEGALVFGVEGPGVPTLSVIRPPADDGLSIAFTDGVTIYERSRVLPRIRWAGRATVIPDNTDRRLALADPALPRDTVVLSSDPSGDVGLGDGAEAVVTVEEDSGDVVRVDVDAAGAGYVVVADTIQDSWVAEVDGREVDVVDADHAFAAVPVPAGSHVVELTYRPAGARAGGAITVIALIALIGAVLVDQRRRVVSDRSTRSRW